MAEEDEEEESVDEGVMDEGMLEKHNELCTTRLLYE